MIVHLKKELHTLHLIRTLMLEVKLLLILQRLVAISAILHQTVNSSPGIHPQDCAGWKKKFLIVRRDLLLYLELSVQKVKALISLNMFKLLGNWSILGAAIFLGEFEESKNWFCINPFEFKGPVLWFCVTHYARK